MTDPISDLAAAARAVEHGFLVVVTGAGVSLASGISTFRGTDPGAVWKTNVTELATWEYFRRDPVGSWKWYLERFDRVLEAQPNAAHVALADFETWHTGRGGQFLLVTQNVDPLHERAGSQRLIKVHGSADRVRCSREGCPRGAPSGSLPRTDFDLEAFRQDPSEERLPRCPECGEILRQHVLWFDEFYQGHDDYQWSVVGAAAATADLMLFVGTSFSVGVTDLFLSAGVARGIPIFNVDPGAEAFQGRGFQVLPVTAEELLPAVVRSLSA